MEEAKRAPRRDETWWRAHLEAIDREDMATIEYARREGLSAKQLYRWRKRIRQRAASASHFVALRVETPAPAEAVPFGGCTLLTVGGLRLEMTQLPRAQWLAELATLLRESL